MQQKEALLQEMQRRERVSLMATPARSHYRVEHVAEKPRGWKVSTFAPGPRSEHLIVMGFPKGPRRKGSGRLLEILHPPGEANPCTVSNKAKRNPEELLIFNPASKQALKRATRERAARIRVARLNAGTAGHKANCPCFACKHKRGEKNPTKNKKRGGTAATSRKSRRPGRAKRNPVTETEQAVRLFEIFHGKDAREIVEKHVSAAVRKDYTALGKLIAVITDDCGLGERAITQKWDQCSHIDFSEDHVTLASSPDGRQLYAIGGNQNLNGCLGKFQGVDPTKDFIDLGEVSAIVYEARKIHDNFEPVQYVHKFGGEGRTRPAWMFDRLKKQIFFLGGEYLIDITAQISPGIEG